MVLHWEPAQVRRLQASTDTNGMLDGAKAPNKWTPRWTGPHRITAVEDGSHPGSYRYTLDHGGRGKPIKDIKPDKICIFQPWSEGLMSTSPPENDATVGVGTWCEAGELFIVPLVHPWPFGVCKALSTTSDGKVLYQWYTPNSYAATKSFKPMWIQRNKKTPYAAPQPKATTHRPYTGEEADMEITQGDILIHGFTLTKGGYVPEKVLDICSRHADIGWTRKKDTRPETTETKERSTGIEP